MPRLQYVFMIAAPIFAIYLIFRSFGVNPHLFQAVAQRLSLSWPYAVHPDLEDAHLTKDDMQYYMEGDHRSHDTSHDSPPQHGHHHPEYAPHKAPAFSRRIVAVGDLHGDLRNAHTVLKLAGVVDGRGDWANGVDYFVQTGDIIDRGDDTIKLYLWMDRLRAQAKAAGAEVLSHLGNHEWMNAIGDWRYVRDSEIKTFGSVRARQQMITTGRIGKTWAANYTTTSRLPLHSSLGAPNTDYDPFSKVSQTPLSHAAISFVHGGLAPDYPDLTPFPSRINHLGSSLLRKLQSRPFPPPHPPNPYPGLPIDTTTAEDRLYGSDGPLWYRGWALRSEKEVCSQVDDVLQRTGTRRMIMGHTPDFERIVGRCNGKIIIIDTGISHAYGGVLSALDIRYSLTPVRYNAEGDVVEWNEREIVSALYLDRTEILADDERVVEGRIL